METIKIKLTESVIKGVPTDVERITDTEINGFHLRIGKPLKDGSRTKKYYLYYRLGGRGSKAGNYLIGSTNTIDLKDARKRAKDLIGQVSRGIDICGEKQTNKQTQTNLHRSAKVSDLLDAFEGHIKIQRKRPEEVVRAFKADVRPTIGKLRLAGISKQVIVEKCLNPIIKRDALVQANKTLSLLKQTFQFGVETGLIEQNPLIGTRRQNIGGKEKPRSRNLAKQELKSFFTWLNTSTASLQVRQALKLLLLTGCRAQEMTLAKWSNIDFKKQLWTFPECDRKGNKGETKSHVVPITPMMKSSLLTLKSAYSDLGSDYVFPSTAGKIGIEPIDRSACAKFLRRRFENDEIKLEKFVPLDLRRTFQTLLSSLGVDAIVCEKLLSHELQGMLKIYNQYDYMKERKAALIMWDKWLTEQGIL